MFLFLHIFPTDTLEQTVCKLFGLEVFFASINSVLVSFWMTLYMLPVWGHEVLRE